jgi:hypothetical protein
MYANDVQLYSCDRYENMSQCIARLNEDLAAVQRWSMENGLLLNNAKAQVMIICKNHGLLPFLVPGLRFSGCNIPYTTRMRLVQSLLVPLLMYCDVIYSQSSVEVTRMLSVAFNSCARYDMFTGFQGTEAYLLFRSF